MKYIKKFNEELSPSTYLSAARKLREKGHKSRADVLRDQGIVKSNLEDVFFTFYVRSIISLSDYNNIDYKTIEIEAKWDYLREEFTFEPIDYIYYEKGNKSIEYFKNRLLFQNNPVYVSTRKEAVRLHKFLKTVNINITINDLYKEDVMRDLYKGDKEKIEPVSKKRWSLN